MISNNAEGSEQNRNKFLLVYATNVYVITLVARKY